VLLPKLWQCQILLLVMEYGVLLRSAGRGIFHYSCFSQICLPGSCPVSLSCSCLFVCSLPRYAVDFSNTCVNNGFLVSSPILLVYSLAATTSENAELHKAYIVRNDSWYCRIAYNHINVNDKHNNTHNTNFHVDQWKCTCNTVCNTCNVLSDP
jgi:hypothetical protein